MQIILLLCIVFCLLQYTYSSDIAHSSDIAQGILALSDESMRHDLHIQHAQHTVLPAYPWHPDLAIWYLRQNHFCCRSSLPLPIIPISSCSPMHCCVNSVVCLQNHGCTMMNCSQAVSITTSSLGGGMLLAKGTLYCCCCQGSTLSAANIIFLGIMLACGVCVAPMAIDPCDPCHTRMPPPAREIDLCCLLSAIQFYSGLALQQQDELHE